MITFLTKYWFYCILLDANRFFSAKNDRRLAVEFRPWFWYRITKCRLMALKPWEGIVWWEVLLLHMSVRCMYAEWSKCTHEFIAMINCCHGSTWLMRKLRSSMEEALLFCTDVTLFAEIVVYECCCRCYESCGNRIIVHCWVVWWRWKVLKMCGWSIDVLILPD